jgi:hypothetical protein
VRRQPPCQRRPRVGLLGRAASWLVAFALLVQGIAGTGEALGMWMDAHGPDPMVPGHCAAHGAAGHQDHGSGRAGHDHEHCLLCNVAAADCPTPILPLLSAATDRSIVPPPPPAVVAFRKVAYANAARGPPRSA